MGVTNDDIAGANGRRGKWAIASGCFTLLLAAVAFFLPDIDLMPKGGIVGWLLFLAGLAELAFGAKRGWDSIGKAVIGSGAITVLAGLLFIANPIAGYFPVSNFVMAWLVLRGGWVLAMALRVGHRQLGYWLALGGAADILLGLALLVGLPIVAITVSIFGPTRAVVSQFALILAASFAFTGVSQIAIGLTQRRMLPNG